MMNNLPRGTYMTEEDAANEARIARIFASSENLSYLKIGVDDPDKLKPKIDCLLHDSARVHAFFEVKGRTSYAFGSRDDFFGRLGWRISIKKTVAARELFNVTRTPVRFVVEFNCATIAHVDATAIYSPCMVRRYDRNDPADVERGAEFSWDQFFIVTARS